MRRGIFKAERSLGRSSVSLLTQARTPTRAIRSNRLTPDVAGEHVRARSIASRPGQSANGVLAQGIRRVADLPTVARSISGEARLRATLLRCYDGTVFAGNLRSEFR